MTTEERKRTLNNRPPPFPEDFGERLEGLKELSGLSWGEFAERLSVTQRGLAKWRRGGPPSGAYLWAIIKLAREVPGGYDLIMYGDDEAKRYIIGLRDLEPVDEPQTGMDEYASSG